MVDGMAEEDDELPDDIAEEKALAEQLRAEPGFFKRRNKAPNLFVQAWRTPGEVAVLFLGILGYSIGLALYLVSLGPERAKTVPGVVHCLVLALLVLPAWMAANFVWRRMGVAVRQVVRCCVRLWPVSFVAILALLRLFALAMNTLGQAGER